MEEALVKNPNIRTASVGALADAVGHAYGLEGDHRTWATVTQAELKEKVDHARPGTMERRAPMAVARDPFAAPQADPFASPMRPTDPAAGRSMDQAFENVRVQEYQAAGVPQSSGFPIWLIAVIVGGVFLVGASLAAFALTR